MNSLIKTLTNHATNIPNKAAIIYNDQEYSYSKLWQDAKTLAHHLQAYRGKAIAMMYPNCYEFVCLYLACFMVEAIAVPINYRLKAAEIEYVLNHSEATVLFAHPEQKKSIESIIDNTQVNPCAFNVEKLLNDKKTFSIDTIGEKNPAIILYTSGSTGHPKGVVHSFYTLYKSFNVSIDFCNINSSSMRLISSWMAHGSGLGVQLMSMLLMGGTCVLLEKPNIDHFIRHLEKYPITHLHTTPAFANDVFNHSAITTKHFAHFKHYLCGGDKIPSSLFLKVKNIVGIPLTQVFGMTELFPVCINRSTDTAKQNSIGRVIPSIKIKVTHPNGSTVSPNEIGEMSLQSKHSMIKYWRNPEETKKTIQDGWLKTGDLIRIDEDGYIWFCGRSKQIIVRRGSNIAPQEVEDVIYDHPAVAQAAVVGEKHDIDGEVPIAFVSLKQGQKISSEELLAFIKPKLAAYKTPTEIIIKDSLPLTPSNKINRNILKKRN